MAQQIFEVGDILKLTTENQDYRYLVLTVTEKPVTAEFSIYEYQVLMKNPGYPVYWTATIDDVGTVYEKVGHIDILDYITSGEETPE